MKAPLLTRRKVGRGKLAVIIAGFLVAGFAGVWWFASNAAQNPAADLNSDNQVNVLDLSILLSHWGQTGAGDINTDNTVSILDLSILLASWGPVATPTPTPSGTPTGGRTCPAYPAPPDASCTGVPSGTSLTTINGDYFTSGAGQTVDSKLITGDVHVNHSGLTIKNTRIKGRIINDAAPGGLVVTDSDIGPDACSAGGSPYNNFNGTNYTLIRSHVHHSGADIMGMGGQGTILIQDSIVNQACFYAGDHLDAIQFYAPGDIGNITITHSLFDSRAVNTSANGNAAIFWADNPGSGSRLTVTQSFLAGGNYTASLYDAGVGSGVILDINNTTFINNSWTYGPCSSSASINFNGTEGVKFTGNKLDNGSALPSC